VAVHETVSNSAAVAYASSGLLRVWTWTWTWMMDSPRQAANTADSTAWNDSYAAV